MTVMQRTQESRLYRKLKTDGRIMSDPILNSIKKIPEGYSEGIYNYKKYGITKSIFNNGNSFKVYGEELGGNDYISFNYYLTKEKDLIKPCEMSEPKVEHFLKNVTMNKTIKKTAISEISDEKY